MNGLAERYWEGNSLYVRTGQRRRFVGVIVPSQFGKSWGVFVRGHHKHELNSEAAARRQLESYIHPATLRGF